MGCECTVPSTGAVRQIQISQVVVLGLERSLQNGKADFGIYKCEKIKSKEKKLDLIVLSPGYFTFAGRQGINITFLCPPFRTAKEGLLSRTLYTETKEVLDALLSLRYYARLRFIQKLLPLHPNRVLSILAATNEGSLIEDDLSLVHNYSIANCVNHSATMNSLAFEHLAKEYPEKSFVHAFPGIVKTPIYWKGLSWWVELIMTWIVAPLLTPFAVSVEECGERTCFYATSARYPPRKSATSSSETRATGVARPEGVDVARGKVDGAYLLNWNGEVGEGKSMRGYRERGMGRVVWEHTVGVFEGVEGKTR